MRIRDITLPIEPGMVLWPNSPPLELERISRIEAGANSNNSRLALGVHTGTHVDAPLHFTPGAAGVESLALDVLVGPAYVLHLPDAARITAEALAAASIPVRTRRLLIRTSNSELWAHGVGEFQPGFVGISAEGADWLVKRSVGLVGVDYLSVAPYKMSRPTHEILLQAGVVVVEGLNLAGVEPGHYDLYCLPLKLVGSDGSPARAILVEA